MQEMPHDYPALLTADASFIAIITRRLAAACTQLRSRANRTGRHTGHYHPTGDLSVLGHDSTHQKTLGAAAVYLEGFKGYRRRQF